MGMRGCVKCLCGCWLFDYFMTVPYSTLALLCMTTIAIPAWFFKALFRQIGPDTLINMK